MISGSQDHRSDRFQSETARPANTRENQIARGKHKSISNRNQCYSALSKHNSSTTANPDTPYLKKKMDLKSHIIMMIKDFEKVINKFL